MRRTIVVVLISILAGAVGRVPVVFAGDDASEREEQAARAERVARNWRRQGVGAAPKAIAALRSGDVWLEEEARRVLVRWGPPAVPALLNWLAGDLGPTKLKMIEGDVPQETLSQLLCFAGRPFDTYPSDDDRTNVADDPRTRARAKSSLKPAMAPLLAALKDKRGRRAQAATGAIIEGAFHKCPNRLLMFEMSGDALVALLDVQPPEGKGEFLLRLSAIGPAARSAVPAALRLINDSRFAAHAIQLLAAIGPDSAPAVPRLRSLLQGNHQMAAADALGQIGPAARVALPDLILLLEKTDRLGCDKILPLRQLVLPIGLLGATGEIEAARALPALLSSLRACPRNEESIITALGALGPRGRAAESTLLSIVKDRSRSLDRRLLAVESLRATGARPTAEDIAIIDALEKERRRQRTPSQIIGTHRQVE